MCLESSRVCGRGKFAESSRVWAGKVLCKVAGVCGRGKCVESACKVLGKFGGKGVESAKDGRGKCLGMGVESAWKVLGYGRVKCVESCGGLWA